MGFGGLGVRFQELSQTGNKSKVKSKVLLLSDVCGSQWQHKNRKKQKDNESDK